MYPVTVTVVTDLAEERPRPVPALKATALWALRRVVLRLEEMASFWISSESHRKAMRDEAAAATHATCEDRSLFLQLARSRSTPRF